jgi:hypothetical protein
VIDGGGSVMSRKMEVTVTVEMELSIVLAIMRIKAKSEDGEIPPLEGMIFCGKEEEFWSVQRVETLGSSKVGFELQDDPSKPLPEFLGSDYYFIVFDPNEKTDSWIQENE